MVSVNRVQVSQISVESRRDDDPMSDPTILSRLVVPRWFPDAVIRTEFEEIGNEREGASLATRDTSRAKRLHRMVRSASNVEKVQGDDVRWI